MKIVEFCIANFRSIGPTQILSFEDINILFLIGQNSSGKTNILKAYDFFFQRKQLHLSNFHNYQEENNIQIKVTIKLDLNDKESLKLNTVKLEENDVNNLISQNDQMCVMQTWDKAMYRSKIELYDFVQKNWIEIVDEDFINNIFNIFPVPIWIRGIDTPQDTQKLIEELLHTSFQTSVREKGIAYAVKGNELKEGKNAEILSKNLPIIKQLTDQYNKLLNEVFPETSFRLFFGTNELVEGDNSKGHIKIEQNGREVGIDSISDGVIRQLIIISSMFKDELKNIASGVGTKALGLSRRMILFEEPELFAHPHTARAIRDLLYTLSSNPNYQMVCTTHSPIMIDLSRGHTSLVRVAFEKGTITNTYQVKHNLFSEEENRSKMKMFLNFNPYVCEAFFAQRVLLVEGDTEAIATKTLIDVLKEMNKLDKKDSIHIVNCGSKMNIPFFQSVLRHFYIPYTVFHDLDKTFTLTNVKSAAWSMNEEIWKEIEAAKAKDIEASRYIFNRNFEDAHKYKFDSSKGKPFSAYEYAMKMGKEIEISFPSEEDMESKMELSLLRFTLSVFEKLSKSIAEDEYDQNFVTANESERNEEKATEGKNDKDKIEK